MFLYIVLTPISTISGLWGTGNTRKYQQIDVYIYQCEGASVGGDLYEITLTFMICLESIFAATNSRKQYTPHYKT